MLIESLKNEIKNMELQRLKLSTIAFNNTKLEVNENESQYIQQSRASRKKALEA